MEKLTKTVSIGIFAWNEERSLPANLKSLFEQSIFQEFATRGRRCEVVCVVNGSTDRTAQVAEERLAAYQREHPAREAVRCRVANLTDKGKLNAWNKFVHEISARDADCLIMMDADILFRTTETLWRMVVTLEQHPEASIVTDRPRKDFLFQKRKGLAARVSAGMSELTGSTPGQLCGQLYCIRSPVARNIYLPKDLLVEDGFIKAVVCTDFLTHKVWPERIRVAEGAEHSFQAYLSPGVVLKNQKRQMIAQTMVHLLVDKHLCQWPLGERQNLGESLRRKENSQPDWLKILLQEHLPPQFWKLYPNLLWHRWRHWSRLAGWKKAACFPAALASVAVSFVASFLAWRSLRAGVTDYWPKAERTPIGLAERAISTSSMVVLTGATITVSVLQSASK